jgi:hypothetical protein
MKEAAAQPHRALVRKATRSAARRKVDALHIVETTDSRDTIRCFGKIKTTNQRETQPAEISVAVLTSCRVQAAYRKRLDGRGIRGPGCAESRPGFTARHPLSAEAPNGLYDSAPKAPHNPRFRPHSCRTSDSRGSVRKLELE